MAGKKLGLPGKETYRFLGYECDWLQIEPLSETHGSFELTLYYFVSPLLVWLLQLIIKIICQRVMLGLLKTLIL